MKRRIVPEAVSAPERLTCQSVNDWRPLQIQGTRSEGAAVPAGSKCAGLERREDGNSEGDSGQEKEASPVLQRDLRQLINIAVDALCMHATAECMQELLLCPLLRTVCRK